MADAQTPTTQDAPEKPAKSPAETVVDTLTAVSKSMETVSERVDSMGREIEELKKPQRFHIRKGESVLSSRPYSLHRLAVALAKRNANYDGWGEQAKTELNLSKRLTEAYYGNATWSNFGGGVLCPLGTDLMPIEERVAEIDGKESIQKGMDSDLVEECRQIMRWDRAGDPGEMEYLYKAALRKDMSANTATTGGTLVGFASQGELIELLRAREVFSQAGAQEVDLPPQGKIRYPRQTSSVTIAATSEGATISESTPGTGGLTLTAKSYTGLVDVSDELLRFATSASVEAMLRMEFIRELALKADRDMISGAGGVSIQGVINYSGISTVTATTTGANGDTLEAVDPRRLFADIADNNAPVEEGFFYALTNTLWAALMNRRADAVTASDAAGDFLLNQSVGSGVGAGRTSKTLDGNMVVCSTQVPTNREKGSATDLTLLLGGVGREWLIARAGVVEVAMTNSDASKFQTRTNTLRGTQYLDAGPRHEESFGMIDDVTNS